jgi:hypothetical protein
MKGTEKRGRPPLKKDKRRKHRHCRVTIIYQDGDKFARVYTDLAKATSFAEQQKKSNVVRETVIVEVGRQGLRE